MHLSSDGRYFANIQDRDRYEAKKSLLFDDTIGIPKIVNLIFDLFSRAYELKLDTPDRSKFIYFTIQMLTNLLLLNIPPPEHDHHAEQKLHASTTKTV